MKEKKKRLSFLPDGMYETDSMQETGDMTEVSNQPSPNARYRSEQNVRTLIGGEMRSQVDVKKEFFIQKLQASTIKVEIVENLIKAFPEAIEAALKLMTGIENLMSTVTVAIDSEGKIASILNHKDMMDRWEEYKEHIKDEYGYLRNKDSKRELDRFIDLMENQIVNPEKLKASLEQRLFFHLLFDTYLMGDPTFNETIERPLHSQLFEGLIIPATMSQDIIKETENTVTLRRVSSYKQEDLDMEELHKQYNEKYKPLALYSFSEYKISFRETVVYDLRNRFIIKADVSIMEEVKNNAQLLVNYSLKKIET